MAETFEQKHPSAGHPSIEEVKQFQDMIPTSETLELLDYFWSAEQNLGDFLGRCLNCGMPGLAGSFEVSASTVAI